MFNEIKKFITRKDVKEVAETAKDIAQQTFIVAGKAIYWICDTVSSAVKSMKK